MACCRLRLRGRNSESKEPYLANPDASASTFFVLLVRLLGFLFHPLFHPIAFMPIRLAYLSRVHSQVTNYISRFKLNRAPRGNLGRSCEIIRSHSIMRLNSYRLCRYKQNEDVTQPCTKARRKSKRNQLHCDTVPNILNHFHETRETIRDKERNKRFKRCSRQSLLFQCRTGHSPPSD